MVHTKCDHLDELLLFERNRRRHCRYLETVINDAILFRNTRYDNFADAFDHDFPLSLLSSKKEIYARKTEDVFPHKSINEEGELLTTTRLKKH